MPTLDRSLLAWSDDSDTEDVAVVDDDRLLLATPGGGGGGASCYDRACASAIDDVLVPAGGADGGGGESPAPGARKAFAAAGLVAVGCLCAYLAWRYCGGGTGKLHASA